MLNFWPFNRKPHPIDFSSIVCKPGDIVVLSFRENLSDEQWKRAAKSLDDAHKETGVRFFVVENAHGPLLIGDSELAPQAPQSVQQKRPIAPEAVCANVVQTSALHAVKAGTRCAP